MRLLTISVALWHLKASAWHCDRGSEMLDAYEAGQFGLHPLEATLLAAIVAAGIVGGAAIWWG